MLMKGQQCIVLSAFVQSEWIPVLAGVDSGLTSVISAISLLTLKTPLIIHRAKIY